MLVTNLRLVVLLLSSRCSGIFSWPFSFFSFLLTCSLIFSLLSELYSSSASESSSASSSLSVWINTMTLKIRDMSPWVLSDSKDMEFHAHFTLFPTYLSHSTRWPFLIFPLKAKTTQVTLMVHKEKNNDDECEKLLFLLYILLHSWNRAQLRIIFQKVMAAFAFSFQSLNKEQLIFYSLFEFVFIAF